VKNTSLFVPRIEFGVVSPIGWGAVKVQLLRLPEVGVPNTGVTRVGDVENTRLVDVVPVAPDAV
jgi:hypothetical protein